MPTWNLVRLELAGTSEYPEGSASRAYMLRVPLDDAGLIDEAALAATELARGRGSGGHVPQ
jgi:hypothetical protein